MHLVIQKRASCSIILMLLGDNCEFFSLVFTRMLPLGILIFFWKPHSLWLVLLSSFWTKTPPRLFLNG